MNAELSSAELQGLLGLSRQSLSELVAAGVIVRTGRGRYTVESITRYVERLREAAAPAHELPKRSFACGSIRAQR